MTRGMYEDGVNINLTTWPNWTFYRIRGPNWIKK